MEAAEPYGSSELEHQFRCRHFRRGCTHCTYSTRKSSCLLFTALWPGCYFHVQERQKSCWKCSDTQLRVCQLCGWSTATTCSSGPSCHPKAVPETWEHPLLLHLQPSCQHKLQSAVLYGHALSSKLRWLRRRHDCSVFMQRKLRPVVERECGCCGGEGAVSPWSLQHASVQLLRREIRFEAWLFQIYNTN